MKKLRRYLDLHGDQRKLCGAVLPNNVHDYALNQGLYVIKQTGDAIGIEEPLAKQRLGSCGRG